MTKLLTTSEAARIAGVAPSSIKRWAEQNVLPCVRTAGGHRRFELKDLEFFISSNSFETSHCEGERKDHAEFIQLMVDGKQNAVVGRLYQLLDEVDAWCNVADAMAPVLAELGTRWASGEISIGQEHMASETLSRAIIQVTSALPTAPQAKRCLLAVAEGDDHELGLRLADLCVRARQWRPVWLGRFTSTQILLDHMKHDKFEVVALSASKYSVEPGNLAGITERLSAACQADGTRLVLGGSGQWPSHHDYAIRLRSFGEFDKLLSNSVRVNA